MTAKITGRHNFIGDVKSQSGGGTLLYVNCLTVFGFGDSCIKFLQLRLYLRLQFFEFL